MSDWHQSQGVVDVGGAEQFGELGLERHGITVGHDHESASVAGLHR